MQPPSNNGKMPLTLRLVHSPPPSAHLGAASTQGSRIYFLQASRGALGLEMNVMVTRWENISVQHDETITWLK